MIRLNNKSLWSILQWHQLPLWRYGYIQAPQDIQVLRKAIPHYLKRGVEIPLILTTETPTIIGRLTGFRRRDTFSHNVTFGLDTCREVTALQTTSASLDTFYVLPHCLPHRVGAELKLVFCLVQ